MQPGTFHFVVTVADSLSIGYMFYPSATYEKMLFTQLQLHADGQRISNSDYPGSSIYLFYLIGLYRHILDHEKLLPLGDKMVALAIYKDLEQGKSNLNISSIYV